LLATNLRFVTKIMPYDFLPKLIKYLFVFQGNTKFMNLDKDSQVMANK
jgi:hypothetical protein